MSSQAVRSALLLLARKLRLLFFVARVVNLMIAQDLVTPLLALFGALAGGVLSQLFSGGVAERREDRRLIRDARMKLERWASSQAGPGLEIQYPGMPSGLLEEITLYANRTFLQRYLDSSFELMVALGSVKPFDARIAKIMDGYEASQEWRISAEDIPDLRMALREAELRVRLWKFWQ